MESKQKSPADMPYSAPASKTSKSVSRPNTNKPPESTANNEAGAGGGKFKTKTGVNAPMNAEMPIHKEY